MSGTQSIRTIIFQEGDTWVAQCLEHDIGAQAKDLDTLQSRLDVVIHAELAESLKRTGAPFGGIDKAPQHFFDMWEKRARNVTPSPFPIRCDHKTGEVQLALCA